ncbi:MAG TPA: UDP-N-acetylmuramoyl-L-alanine--D-glutamate ligase [Spongiibacteraceae bacterium]|nr:UDP-N-acetylmuramoyl-L-alanine--D-glutamate ligase [Spongiibacteraceae bacterium]HCS28153.1 UDP-N-acetylmuramoyl-L-alanine--D-glutamate ligase [Spongiibacteraceae bacterium]
MSLIATDKLRIVIGLGATGLSCARFLHSRQLAFRVADSRLNPPGLAEFQREFPEVELALGDFSVEQFVAADELYVSPGVSLKEPAIAAAIANGVRVSGDLDLFVQNVQGPVAAITGSNGKSTVTTLLGEMAAKDGKRVAVGGNLGTPMLDLLSNEHQLYVLELSSFQLERCAKVNAEVATVLNVSEDHIDHHGSLLAYHQAKHRVFRGCRQAVVNRDDTLTQPLVPEDVRFWRFGLANPGREEFGLIEKDGETWLAFGSELLMACSELHIAGQHNIANALAALALGKALGLAMPSMLAALKEFKGLPHRCQWVGHFGGVDFFDDSKGTNVGAAVASLNGLAKRCRVVLIAGGQSKGADFAALIDTLVDVGRAAVFIGEAADDLTEQLDERLPSMVADNMESAVNAAFSMARSGDAVLLSPACASFDMFKNYEHRGQCFSESVAHLAAGGAR